jgi:uncharacterized RmlC-like cupin family protein
MGGDQSRQMEWVGINSQGWQIEAKGLRAMKSHPVFAAMGRSAGSMLRPLVGILFLPFVLFPSGVQADEVIGTPGDGGIITVRPDASIINKQRLSQFVGISGSNSGARGLSLSRVVIPPGVTAAAHQHLGSESAIYIVKGTIRTRYGAHLEHSIVNREGDFLFIPPGVPHEPTNLSNTEPAVAIVARNDPQEQEHVRLIDGKTHSHP